jgi:hypothetical protein
MNNFKILVCDDSKTEREDIKLFVNKIFQNSVDITLDITLSDFHQMNEHLDKDYDLLILDLVDDNAEHHKDAGTRILMRNHNINQIPTVVYTGTGDSLGFDEDEVRSKYPSLKKKITKVHDSYDNLVQFVKAYILGNLKKQEHFQLYNEHDVSLALAIRLIGVNNFSYITYLIYEEIGKQIITVYPMVTGFSGAILFKLKYGTKTSILKLSADIEALKKEHENAMKLYHDFPSHLINHIETKEYYAIESRVLGILIKNVDDAQTFLDFLLNPKTKKVEIENFLNTLYLDGNGLKDHFLKNRKESKDWSAIFDQMDGKKLLMVESSLKELQSIIIEFYAQSIDIDEIKNLTLDNKYKHLNVEQLLDKKYQKSLVLSHGDFHAKNVMVQNGHRPIIIDTGLLGYKHWSLDVCRLIVNIFTVAVDLNRINYFDLNSIPENLDMAQKIINRLEIQLDGNNDDTIMALNWLIKNVQIIYGELYTLFEFQLGLMKEFLQVAYRVESIPPNKRALALMAAHMCMLAAEQNVQSI